MPNIGAYTETTQWVLGEAGKYFALLLFSVLAVRLWRFWARAKLANHNPHLLLAVTATVIAAAIGYFSMRQSLGKLYLHYGMEAFGACRVPQALSLFETSEKFWDSADAVGGEGVCLLVSGDTAQGEQFIGRAKAMRKGQGTPFEEFYEGLYFFTQNQTAKAVPLLEAASADTLYRWSVTKIFAVMELDAGHPEDAAALMKPFMQAEIAESDQAYIVVSLQLAAGKTNEARAILKQFPPETLTPLWKKRFEKLDAQIKK